MTLRYSTTVITDRLTSLNTDIGINAILRIYSGAQPASVATAASGTLLVSLPCNATAFGAIASGALTANAITTTAAAATGTAGCFRLFKADGVTAVVDGSVGTTASDINLNSTSITASQNVSITSYVITGAPV
jgi:hypothetical protein